VFQTAVSLPVKFRPYHKTDKRVAPFHS